MVANKINEGTTISGDVSAQTDIRLDGKVTGNIHCSSKVVIGNTANITGHIKCNDLTIEGKVKGNIEVSGVLFFCASAVFDGDVKYKKLIVEEGANITGSLVNMAAVKPVQQIVQNGQQSQTQQTATVQTAG
ncbi:MAG: Integral rane protein CcmA involved in cell shape determination [Bacteroidota bacterium]|nr:Integral rane protein CcmA involved in cell shape determination [Bacteroidota bacterium]